jgi:hypothetical protein
LKNLKANNSSNGNATVTANISMPSPGESLESDPEPQLHFTSTSFLPPKIFMSTSALFSRRSRGPKGN